MFGRSCVCAYVHIPYYFYFCMCVRTRACLIIYIFLSIECVYIYKQVFVRIITKTYTVACTNKWNKTLPQWKEIYTMLQSRHLFPQIWQKATSFMCICVLVSLVAHVGIVRRAHQKTLIWDVCHSPKYVYEMWKESDYEKLSLILHKPPKPNRKYWTRLFSPQNPPYW